MNRHASTGTPPIPFVDVAAQRRRLGSSIDEAIARVTAHCQFIQGPEVFAFERDLAQFCGARHVVSCASGTDALLMVLMARDIGPGDAVFCPAFTFCATAEAVVLVGATPVFVDVRESTFNIDVDSLRRAIASAEASGLRAKAVIPVDLFGLPADHDAIAAVAREHGLFVLDDAAQAFGATYHGRKVGTLAAATATSFFPAKPLGGYGDGGAIATDDDELADVLRSLRAHGAGADRYDNVRIGINGRLDTLQAAVLIEKLRIFPQEIEARGQAAERYRAALADIVAVPVATNDATSVWAQFTLRVASETRDRLAAALRADGIPTAIYYPKPLNRQQAYCRFPVAPGGVGVSERLSKEVISLPMHAYLDAPTQDRVIAAVRRAVKSLL
ncbi:MAG: DegT/DnrJ/EryC1/StrS family aminotransferase [Proteobacteria bacterium]|nr:DegT/DnrJ/EryC1/StrS family aminotransferase [Pseudomonadota bacterium]